MGRDRHLFVQAAVAAGFLALVAGGPAAAQVQIGAWTVSIDDGARGRPVKTAILMASDGASLIAACDPEGVDLLVSYIDVLPKKPQVPVEWRVDGGAPHRQLWQEDADHSSLSPGGPDVDAAVLKQIARGHRLTVSAAGRRSTFDLTGVRQIENLVGQCPAAAPPAPAKSPG